MLANFEVALVLQLPSGMSWPTRVQKGTFDGRPNQEKEDTELVSGPALMKLWSCQPLSKRLRSSQTSLALESVPCQANEAVTEPERQAWVIVGWVAAARAG